MAKKLYRSTSDKMIGGVCGGLAQYLGMDSSLVRILSAVVILFTNGIGLLAYILAWILVPEGDSYEGSARSTDPEQRRKLIGGILIGAGGLLFIGRIIPGFDFRIILAVALVAAGVYIIVQKR